MDFKDRTSTLIEQYEELSFKEVVSRTKDCIPKVKIDEFIESSGIKKTTWYNYTAGKTTPLLIVRNAYIEMASEFITPVGHA